MLTSLEIAKLLSAQKRQNQSSKGGFDSALLGLGVRVKMNKKKTIK